MRNWFRQKLLSFCLWLLDDSLLLDLEKIDSKAYDRWCYESFDDDGWRSYFAYESIKVLKEMGMGKPRDEYMQLVGRRLQLLIILNDMKQAHQRRQKKKKKKKT